LPLERGEEGTLEEIQIALRRNPLSSEGDTKKVAKPMILWKEKKRTIGSTKKKRKA